MRSSASWVMFTLLQLLSLFLRIRTCSITSCAILPKNLGWYGPHFPGQQMSRFEPDGRSLHQVMENLKDVRTRHVRDQV